MLDLKRIIITVLFNCTFIETFAQKKDLQKKNDTGEWPFICNFMLAIKRVSFFNYIYIKWCLYGSDVCYFMWLI